MRTAIAEIWESGCRDAHIGHVPDELVAVRTSASNRERAVGLIDGTSVAVADGEIAGFVTRLATSSTSYLCHAPTVAPAWPMRSWPMPSRWMRLARRLSSWPPSTAVTPSRPRTLRQRLDALGLEYESIGGP